MRRKRLQHHTDIFCDMFAGWKITNDMKSLILKGDGIIEFDFLNKTQKLNDEKFELNIFYEIYDWFIDDLVKHNIQIESIEKAKLKVEFKVVLISGKTNSRTKGITELYLNLNASILTDEKAYFSKKEKTQEFHHLR